MSIPITEIKKALLIPSFEYPKFNDITYFFTEDKPYKAHRNEAEGAAITWANGDCSYYLAGKLHRLEGPAIVRASGKYEDTAFYIWGKAYSEEEHIKLRKLFK